MAAKQSELRDQKSLAAEGDRKRMRLLNALSRGHTINSDDSESFCKYKGSSLITLIINLGNVCVSSLGTLP